MVKIKRYYVYTLQTIAIATIAIVALPRLAGRASAVADPGCYAVSTSVQANNKVLEKTTKSTCPDRDIQDKGDNEQMCFTTNISSGGQSEYKEVSCTDVEVGDVTTGTASTPIPDSNSGIKPDLDGEGTELDGEYYCGKGSKKVRISFDIGCLGESYYEDEYNPILDMLFAMFRFVSAGVGIVVTGSIVWAGIQYSASRGDPKGTEASIKRVTNAVIALLIYVFAWAILNFVVPGGMFL